VSHNPWPIVLSYLRPYQRRFLTDRSQFRICIKSRQIGFSTLIALEMVLVASGLGEVLGIAPGTCNVISKSEKDSKEVIKKSREWVRVLSKDPNLLELLRLDGDAKTYLSFAHTGHRIISHTQSKGAGRGFSGHLYLDEYAFYAHQDAIWTASIPTITANPDYRLTVITTPNGTNEHAYDIWHEESKYSMFSRHFVDVHQAIREGHPVKIGVVKQLCKSQADFEQEFECAFVSGANQYLSRDLWRSAHAPRTEAIDTADVFFGVDVASEQDLTAIQVLYVSDAGLYLGDTYVIDGGRYSRGDTDTPAQDDILSALIARYRPSVVAMDATGDGAELFGYIVARSPTCQVIPHKFTHQWKEKSVPGYRGALERSQLHVLDGRRDLIYDPRAGGELSINGEVLRPAEFVEGAFAPSYFAYLLQHHLKVHKRQTANGMTYDTARDSSTGHGDSFWASCMAHWYASNLGRQRQHVPEAPVERFQRPSYTSYM
jgi:phage FluMu gp28-like protein